MTDYTLSKQSAILLIKTQKNVTTPRKHLYLRQKLSFGIGMVRVLL